MRRLHSDLPLALVAAGAAALTALVNVPRAVGYSFWQDEVGSARVITDPGPISMLRRVVGTENHPGGRLEVADWNGRACDRVYVISVGGRGRALTDGVETQRVRRIVIGRIPYRPELAGEARRRDGRLLATRASSCARVA